MMRSLFSRTTILFLNWVISSSALSASIIAGDDGDITITPLVHSSVQLEYQGLVIQVDPWNAISLSNYKAADIILVTDNPGHHLDVDAISALSHDETIVVAPPNSRNRLIDAVILMNGENTLAKGVNIDAIAAYDLVPGPPEHPKGDANGYVLTLGGKRFLFTGVTECVDEVRELQDIDVAFMPLNIPPSRMTPADSADCTKQIDPDVVYTYHYDQDYARRVNNPDYAGSLLPGGYSIAESLDAFEAALNGSGIEYRRGNWYPPRFELDRDWPKIPLGRNWLTGGLGGMCIGSDDRIVLLNRQNVVEEDLDGAHLAPPVITLDTEGNTLSGWGDSGDFGGRLHDCYAYDDGSLWIVPAATGHIQHWSSKGELLKQIGNSDAYDSSDGTRDGVPLNSDRPQFFLPAAIDVDETNGDLYVADGELPGGNSRIAVFNKEGEFLRQWALERTANDLSLQLPHCLRLSKDGLVYVCDRRGDRIQVFQRDGSLAKVITAPFSSVTSQVDRTSGTRGDAVVLDFSADDAQQYLYVINQNSNTVEVLDRIGGDWITRFGEGPGRYPGQFQLPHGIGVDSEGNVYIAEQEGRRVQRFLLRR